MLGARCRLGERTSGGPQDNGEDAPKADSAGCGSNRFAIVTRPDNQSGRARG